jgi:hypothetical protein
LCLHLVGFGDYVPTAGLTKMFMILAVLLGIWLLSILVAAIHNHTHLNEDENKVCICFIQAYKSINRIFNGPSIYLKTVIKLIVLKKFVFKKNSLANSTKKLAKFFHCIHSFHIYKALLLHKKTFQEIFKHFRDYSYSDDNLFSLIDILNENNIKCFEILEYLEDGIEQIKLDCVRSRNLSYSMVNLAKGILIHSSVGKLTGKIFIYFRY